MNLVIFNNLTELEKRFSHPDSHLLGFIGAGHNTSVVVGQHHYRFAV